jgi:hypothetical protein
MKLPHIESNVTTQNVDEAVTMNLFAVQFIPPAGVVVPEGIEDEIVSIGGLDVLDKIPDVVKQVSRGHTRNFSGAFIDDQTVELSMVVNLNMGGKKSNHILIHRMFKQWARLQRDDRTGALGLKKDYVGQIIIDQTNTVGDPWRNIDLRLAFIQEITGLDEIGLENGDAVQLNVTIVAEQPKVTYEDY